MIEKSCRCGKIKKNFKIDIGPFFIADCCIEAGYDYLGNKAELKVEDLGLKEDEVQKAIEASGSLQIVDDVVDTDDREDEKLKVPEKKKRQYNRNGQLKIKS